MGLLEGKKGLILGVANQKSIAWGIAQACHEEGATLGFTYLNEALEKRVRPLAESLGSEMILPCDVQSDEQLDALFANVKDQWGELDFVIHSLAFANGDDLKVPFHETSRAGFNMALEVSAYSLISVANRAVPLMKPGSSIVTMTYLGATRVAPNYKIMGVAKAALESCVRELAYDLGEHGIRVNAISAGPIKTLAASGIAGFRNLKQEGENRAPIKNVTNPENVGKSTVYFVSDSSRAVSGEIHFVDGGFHITAG